MKKLLLMLAVVLVCSFSYGQKSKKATAKASANKSTLAKSGAMTAELFKSKTDYKLYVLMNNKEKDTLSLKTFPTTTAKENLPVDFTITAFTSKGTALHNISWTEKSLTEIPDKKEDRITTVTEIWNTATKTQLHSNVQASTKITEILWLDKGKNASQTSEKMRNEGFILTLNPEGDIILKNKTQENKLIYNATDNRYDPVKSAPPAAASKPAAKKRR